MGVRTRGSAGGAQFALAVSSSAVTLTVPSGANVAQVYVRGASITYTTDGTAPTATKGIQADPGDTIMLDSAAEVAACKMIRVSSDATVDVEFFTDAR